MKTLNRPEIGKRIRSLRLELGLRQWQLAEMLQTTQPAIHKYERGIIPEVNRLLRLAEIGNTTVEWILTGRHCETGSRKREKLATELFDLADRLRRITGDQKQSLDSTLRLLETALGSLEGNGGQPIAGEAVGGAGIERELSACDRETLAALRSAIRIHSAVTRDLAASKVQELDRAELSDQQPMAARGASPDM